jgi:hypothetical protein
MVMQLRPSEVASTLKWCALARKPVHIIGAPGTGKTSIGGAVMDELGWDMMVTRIGELETVDARGLPVMDIKKGTTRWLPPDEFPKEGCKPVGWFFDEYMQGLPPVQAVYGRLLNERKLGEYVLPDQVYIFAASNRLKDRSATNKMPLHIADRFFWVELVQSVDDWLPWAFKAGIEIEVIAFVKWKPEILSAFDAAKEISPSARSLEDISVMMKTKRDKKLIIPENLEERVYAGKIGEGYACELMGFLKIFRKLGDPAAMLMHPDTCELPSDPATLCAVSTAIARLAKDGNMDRVTKIANRMPEEFGVMLMILATGRDSKLASTRSFIQYATEHQGVLN